MSDNTKYITDYSWRTIVSMVILLPTANTYRASVSPIDVGEPGALLPIQEGFLLVDNAGHIFPVISVGTGTIDVEDRLLCGEHPVTGMVGIVCKTANKGNSIYIPQGQLNYLDKTAQHYIDSVVWSVLWANDPNPRRIAFTNEDMPQIADYTADVVDMDSKTFNPREDYGENPKFEIWTTEDNLNYAKQQIEPYITRNGSGQIVSVIFSGDGSAITGYIIISR